jgi:AraC-like DNA-binding protein
MIMTLENSNILESYKLFSPIIFIPGFYIFFLIWCYIAELIRPHLLTLKRTALILLPSVLVAIPIIALSALGDITNIYSTVQLRAHISEFNVYIRIAFVALFIPYCIGLIYMRYKHKNTEIQKYIDLLIICLVLMVGSYIASRCMQIFVGYIFHEIFYLIISVFIVYAEHYERLHVPLEKVRDYYTWDQLPHATQNTVNTVAQALQRIMNDPSVWQDSELTGDKIVHLVGTNRTYIQQAAKQLGFANLSDMLNRRRIDYVCQQLRKDPNIPVQTLFVDAGYRSRTTAWRHFTTIVGCTPSEFLERHANTEKSRT